MPATRVFLLSPARCDGKRAQVLLRDAAAFPLARQVRAGGAPLGEVFTFLSGLYFRGKLAYAKRFAATQGAWIITTNRGLVSPDTIVTIDDLRQFGCTDIHESDDAYRGPLLRDALQLAEQIGPRGQAVLLGSVATGKYVDVLLAAFGEKRLLFPTDFAGRGDMSRGGLMLRRVTSGEELAYAPVATAVRHGQRPPKLEPIKRQTFYAKTPKRAESATGRAVRKREIGRG